LPKQFIKQTSPTLPPNNLWGSASWPGVLRRQNVPTEWFSCSFGLILILHSMQSTKYEWHSHSVISGYLSPALLAARCPLPSRSCAPTSPAFSENVPRLNPSGLRIYFYAKLGRVNDEARTCTLMMEVWPMRNALPYDEWY